MQVLVEPTQLFQSNLSRNKLYKVRKDKNYLLSI